MKYSSSTDELAGKIASVTLKGTPKEEANEKEKEIVAPAPSPQVDQNQEILARACQALCYPRGCIAPMQQILKGVVFHQELGQGSLSIVFLVSFPHQKSPVALKLCKFKRDPDCRVTGYSKERDGGEMLSINLKSPYLVKTHALLAVNSDNQLEWIQNPAARKTESGAIVAVVQEYVPEARRLFDDIVQGKINSAKKGREVASSIALGLYDLHKKFNMPHRDVKPENILMGKTGIKIIDFSFLTRKEKTQSRCGSPAYLAPEVVCADETEYDAKLVDAFSFATLLFVMRFWKSPWWTLKEADMASHLDLLLSFYHNNGNLRDYFPKDIKAVDERDTQLFDLIGKLGTGDPKQRMSVVEAVETHPYFAHLKEKLV
ncbi:MAG: serine/threonine-protein kinase [Chlamydiales bacterium]|nr:serine/threonine-protein kinase [Chlamydiales bacterium]